MDEEIKKTEPEKPAVVKTRKKPAAVVVDTPTNEVAKPAVVKAAQQVDIGDGKTAERKVRVSVNKKQAQSAAPQNPEFRSLRTVEELVAAYNDMVPTAADFGMAARPVKSFVDVKTGVLACERLHAQIQKTRIMFENKKEDTTMAKKAKKTATKKTAKKTAGKPRAKFDQKAKIEWLGKDNPFREGSEKHRRAELVRKANGKTVDTYLASGGSTGTLGRCCGIYKLTRVSAPAGK